MKSVSIKGVLIGSITDILATNLLSIPVFMYVMASRNLFGVPEDQLNAAMAEAFQGSSGLFILQLVVGISCSVLGGYVAARIAKRHELLNGGLAAFLCVGSGMYALFFLPLDLPLWQHLLGFIVSPAASTFGGFVQMKSKRPRAKEAIAS